MKFPKTMVAAILGVLTLFAAERLAWACGGTSVPFCGRTIWLALMAQRNVLLQPNVPIDVHFRYLAYLAWNKNAACAQPAGNSGLEGTASTANLFTNANLTYNVTCTPLGGTPVQLGPFSQNLNTPVDPGLQQPDSACFTIPASSFGDATTPVICEISATFSADFTNGTGSGTISSSNQTVICLVPPSPDDNTKPRLDLQYYSTSATENFFQQCPRGDQTYFYFLARNNDTQNSVKLDVSTELDPRSGLPDGFDAAQAQQNFEANVYSIQLPEGDFYPHQIVNNPASWEILPDGNPESNPSGLNQSLTLMPDEARFIVVCVKSLGMCGNGSCNKLTVRLEGTFSDGSPALACAGSALLVDDVPAKSRRCEIQDRFNTDTFASAFWSSAQYFDDQFQPIPNAQTHFAGNTNPSTGNNLTFQSGGGTAEDIIRFDPSVTPFGAAYNVSASSSTLQRTTINQVGIDGLPTKVDSAKRVPVIYADAASALQVIINCEKDSIRIKTEGGEILHESKYSVFLVSTTPGFIIDHNTCRTFTKTATPDVPEICSSVYYQPLNPGQMASIQVFDQNDNPLQGTVQLVSDNSVSLESTTFNGVINLLADDQIPEIKTAMLEIQVPRALPEIFTIPIVLQAGEVTPSMLAMNHTINIQDPIINPENPRRTDNVITPGEGQTYQDVWVLNRMHGTSGIEYSLTGPGTLTEIDANTDPNVLQRVSDRFGSELVDDCTSGAASCATVQLGDVSSTTQFTLHAQGFQPGVYTTFYAANGTNTTTSETSADLGVLDQDDTLPVSDENSLRRAIGLRKKKPGSDDLIDLTIKALNDIFIEQPLPDVEVAKVTLRGASQEGSGTSNVTLDGSNCPEPCNGLVLAGGNSSIENIRFADFPDYGVVLESDSNTVISSEFVGNGQGGLLIAEANDSVIGGTLETGNRFTDNGRTGLLIESGTGNAALFNTFADNAGLGIDLGGDGITSNDAGDDDTGANDLQNFPELTNVQMVPDGGTLIEGTLQSAANASFMLQFFTSDECDASGNGEGASFLGSGAVNIDANGQATFSITMDSTASLGQFVTATATDSAGNTSEFSACFEITTAVSVEEPENLVPTEFALFANFPNPFNPETTIRYGVPKTAHVRLIIFNLRGQVVRTLVDEQQTAGFHGVKWDGLSDSGEKLASGVYVYRLKAEQFVQTRQMLMLK